jgi:ABC-type oligopeptide transport system substrate-binding subunit
MWSNERFDELVEAAQKETDAAVRNNMLKEAAIIMLDSVNIIPTDPRPMAHYWWPWVKNYYGERAVADKNIADILARAWIDEELKAEMGY